MRSRYTHSLTIEVEGTSEILEGKRWYFLSSENRAADLFFKTDSSPVNLNVFLLKRGIILIRRGKSFLRATGKSLLSKVYFSRDTLTIYLEDCPVTLSVTKDPSLISSVRVADRAPLCLSAFCLVASIVIISYSGKGTYESPSDRRVAEKISLKVSTESTIIDSLCYSRLDEVLLRPMTPGKGALTKLSKSLHLSRRIYETGGDVRNSRIIGRIIGGVSHRLHRMKNIKQKSF